MRIITVLVAVVLALAVAAPVGAQDRQQVELSAGASLSDLMHGIRSNDPTPVTFAATYNYRLSQRFSVGGGVTVISLIDLQSFEHSRRNMYPTVRGKVHVTQDLAFTADVVPLHLDQGGFLTRWGLAYDLPGPFDLSYLLDFTTLGNNELEAQKVIRAFRDFERLNKRASVNLTYGWSF